MTGKLKIAVIGAGYVSRHHLAALRRISAVQLQAVVDLNLDAARALAAEFGVPRACATLQELADLLLDAVYVLTPPSSHCPLAMQALARGCHVLVEKPMAETVADCDRMIEAARNACKVLSVNHSDRLDPVVLQALALVDAGACGQLVNVDLLRGSEYPPYPGGPFSELYAKGSYPFQDLGVHGLYVLEAFLGPLSAVDIRYRSSGNNLHLQFDEWHAFAEGPRGIGRLQLSWNARPMQSRLIVQGTRGYIEVDRFLQTCRINRVLPGPKFIGMVVNAVRNGLAQAFGVPWNVVRFATGRLRPSPGIQHGAEGFARALIEGRPPPVSAAEGRRPIALMASVCAAADAERSAAIAARLQALEPADVLVTGAAGFLGRALVTRLAGQGLRVRALVRRRPAWLDAMPGVHAVCGDLGDADLVAHAVAGVARVYHVGAAMRGGPRDFEAGTIWGTRNVIDACLAHRVQRMVYVSSLSVLDHAGRVDGVPLREDAALEPFPQRRGLYTQTKLEAERMVRVAIDERGLPAVILRPGQIFGPGAERVTPNGVIGLAGRWVRVGFDDPTIPLVYVDDVVDALLLAGTSDAVLGKSFNLVDPTPLQLGIYLEAVRNWPRRDFGMLRVPRALLLAMSAGVALLGRLLRRDVPLTPYRVRSLRPLAGFELRAAREELGWSPGVGVEQGLRRTFG